MLLIALLTPQALNCGSRPCLQGLDTVGIGFNAILGSSDEVSRPVVNFTYSEQKQYHTLFGNRMIYNYPDQASVTTKTSNKEDFTTTIIRSVSDWTSAQSSWSRVNAHGGFFGASFSASSSTKRVSSQVKDGMNVMLDQRLRMSLYQIALNPPKQLKQATSFQIMIDNLPPDYDDAAYKRVIDYYGTHYIKAAELGGLAGMTSTVSSSYASQASNHELEAQANIQWGAFRGGAGGGSSGGTQSQQWKESATSETWLSGGDPKYRKFQTKDEWNAWAESVENSALTQTKYFVEALWEMVSDPGKKANLQKAILAYAAANNKTWPAANPVTYKMGWCDCEIIHAEKLNPHDGMFPQCDNDSPVIQHKCPNDKVVVSLEMKLHDNYQYQIPCQDPSSAGVECCRPCFKA